ncbi:MAG: hypothetical protein GX326_07715 [Clostridiaceae bacterium]|mgnify:CR=1 FL=1|nr:hypothetical protein [Clostridiaceae bacterium]
MNEKKTHNESETWKTEAAREERKERLAQLKDKDGNKKPIKDKGKRNRIISVVLALIIVFGFVVWFLLNNGFLQRHSKAFTVSFDEVALESSATDASTETSEEPDSEVGDTDAESDQASEESQKLNGKVIGDISVAEANIYLGLLSQQYLQGGAFSQMGQDALSQPSQFNPDGTLRDDFLASVEAQAKTGEYFYWQAKQNNLEIDEADQKQLDNIIEQYNDVAAQSQVTLNHYLTMMFGPGVNENVFRDFFMKNTLGSKYHLDLISQFTYDQAIINSTYEDNPDNYDLVDYRSYLFTGVEENTDPENPAEPDMEKAEQDAEEFVAGITDEESFKKAVDTMQIKDVADENPADPDTDTTLTEGARKAYLSPDLAEWLFASERTTNDLAIIEEFNGYRVVLFLDKYKPTDVGSFTSRHILFQIDEDDPEKTDERIKAKAEEVLAEYNAGAKTEGEFAELAREYSEDPGSASNGGLYEKTPVGSFVPEYEEFVTDPSRQEGDVEIVQTDHGYHIIYYIDQYEQWYSTIEQELRHQDEQELMNRINDATDIRRENGIKYFGKP